MSAVYNFANSAAATIEILNQASSPYGMYVCMYICIYSNTILIPHHTPGHKQITAFEGSAPDINPSIDDKSVLSVHLKNVHIGYDGIVHTNCEVYLPNGVYTNVCYYVCLFLVFCQMIMLAK